MEDVGLVISEVVGGVVVLVLGVTGGLVTVRAEWCVLKVVLMRVGPGGPPADDGGGHREPPSHADQAHTEPDCRRSKEVLEDTLDGPELEESDQD